MEVNTLCEKKIVVNRKPGSEPDWTNPSTLCSSNKDHQEIMLLS